ncbi:MAG: efflux transporter outer membrane subunit [Syntrophobacteraceae bacterium]
MNRGLSLKMFKISCISCRRFLRFSGPKVLLGAAVCFCLSACMVGPDFHPPATKMPHKYLATSGGQKTVKPVGNKPVIDPGAWWQGLEDKELDSLIDRAVHSNLTIEMALDRMQEAREAECVVLGQALPASEFSAGGGGGTGSDTTTGRISEPLRSGIDTQGLKEVTFGYGFDAGWELDIFGKYRRAYQAAKYDTKAALDARNAVLISVIADVARSYVDMRALQTKLAVLENNIKVARDYYNFTNTRYQLGITNELDVALAKRELASLQAQKMPLVSQIQAANYVIAVLLGEYPENLAVELKVPGMIPALPTKIDVGIPLNLLRRRPDIRQAENELGAATARIGVATAELFPQLVMTGAAGYQNQGFGISPNLTTSIWSLGPSISAPVLDFGTLDALVEIADYRTRELLANYKQTVLNAVMQVDTAVSTYNAEQDQLLNLETALVASRASVRLASQRYNRGLIDALNVIDAERQQYTLEEQYVSATQVAAEQFIALYRALGGGWEKYQCFPPIRQPRPAILAAFEDVLNRDQSIQW